MTATPIVLHGHRAPAADLTGYSRGILRDALTVRGWAESTIDLVTHGRALTVNRWREHRHLDAPGDREAFVADLHEIARVWAIGRRGDAAALHALAVTVDTWGKR